MPVWTNIPGGLGAGFGFPKWAAKTRIRSFPKWGRPLIALAALPGVAIALLSFVLLVASLLALFLLIFPVYKLVSWASGLGTEQAPVETQVLTEPALPSPGSKTVHATVVDSEVVDPV